MTGERSTGGMNVLLPVTTSGSVAIRVWISVESPWSAGTGRVPTQ